MAASLIHCRLSLALQAVLAVQVVVALLRQQWVIGFFTVGIIVLTLLPTLAARRVHIVIPQQIQLLTIAIVFAALFLGEVRNFYARFWWWDTALHVTTGFFVGIVGLHLLYIFNGGLENASRMKAGLASFLGFMFVMGAGAVWEVAEFLLDQMFDMNLQKTALGDASGLTDTMVDLIADALGAVAVCIYGYLHLRTPARSSFLERWICSFFASNPKFFRRPTEAGGDAAEPSAR